MALFSRMTREIRPYASGGRLETTTTEGPNRVPTEKTSAVGWWQRLSELCGSAACSYFSRISIQMLLLAGKVRSDEMARRWIRVSCREQKVFILRGSVSLRSEVWPVYITAFALIIASKRQFWSIGAEQKNLHTSLPLIFGLLVEGRGRMNTNLK